MTHSNLLSKLFCTLILGFSIQFTMAQFAPAVGKAGSTALNGDSSCFVEWASSSKIHRGLRDISHPDSGFVTVGDSISATGAVKENGVISLGDGGYAILQFKNPIRNGQGWDFAVFENTFLDTFLELAFVEVSTDGKKYVRFANESLTDTIKQTGAFGYTYPEKINNLAGKYVVGYGTPFDLEELIDSAGIDVNNINFVKIIDVVGSLNPAYASYDSKGRKINDPWPTPFPSSGFDLDAVGVIHQNLSAKSNNYSVESSIKIAPNPVHNSVINVQAEEEFEMVLYTISGSKIANFSIQKGQNTWPISLPPGMYLARFTAANGQYSQTQKIYVN